MKLTGLGLGAFALLLTACGGTTAAPAGSSSSGAVRVSPSPAGSAGAATKTLAGGSVAAGALKLTVSHSQVSADQMVTWDALEGGYYRKHGLDVNLKLIESSTGLSALLGGDVQLSVLGGSEAMAAAAGGADVVIVATLMPVYTFKMEVPASIQMPRDLVGKKVGVTRPGSTTDTGVRDSLRKEGLTPDKDVAILPVGSSKQATYAALTSGTVQGTLIQPPDTLSIEKQGFHPLYDLARLDLPAAAAVVVTQRSWAVSHHDSVQAFVDSLVEATAREKKDATFGQAVIKKYFKLDDEQALKTAYDYFSALHPSYPYAKLDQFESIIASVKQQNPNAKGFDFAKVLDSSYVKSAEDRGLASA